MKSVTELPLDTAPPLSRREFLYYIWGASMVVMMAGAGGAALWYILPRFRAGEFGGVFTGGQVPTTASNALVTGRSTLKLEREQMDPLAEIWICL